MIDEPGRDIADAMVSEVLHAYEHELVAEAHADGADLAEAAASMRERFLQRVQGARARGLAVPDSETSSEAASSAWDRDTLDCPRSIGRYAILRRLGSGGMGVVYVAYDELLDRRLAIKVLHDQRWDGDGRRRERLLREAQALAQVTHPNVVTVHEVGTARDQLFVAMEFVEGPTLLEWLVLERRTWQAIVAVFRQVAEGVAALHDAGLVHRDLKPTNVIVGEDGRVRVLDLGLVARGINELFETDESPSRASDSSSQSRIGGSLTMTGERLGTPAYMSREQFMGLEPTPASDIYSLSVALYEALYGLHPFGTGSFQDLQAHVVSGQVRQPPSSTDVPAWLYALVVRGLAPDPEDRPSSMRALSNELARERPRPHRRWTTGLASVGVAGMVGVLVAQARTPTPPPTCDGGEAAMAAVWSSDRSANIRAAMVASERPYAAALAERTTASLDDYADAWVDAHDRSCHEHARGDHSAALLDARMACLDRGREAFVETVEILAEADADVVEHAGQMVANLPRLDACDDLVRLVDRDEASFDLAIAPLVASLESRLVRAEALAHAGRITESTSIARAVATEAEALEQPRLVVHALLDQARAAILHVDRSVQIDRSAIGRLLGRALEISIAEGFDAPAAEAMILRLYVRGLANGGSEAALADIPIAEAMLVRAGDDPELRALLLNNQGAVHVAAGDREAARDAFTRALAVQERLFGDEHLELAVALANLAMLTPDPAARSALHQRMIVIDERRLGPNHPRTLDDRLRAAFHTADPQLAASAFEQVCPRFLAIGELRLSGACELERGRIEMARGRLAAARRAFELAREQLDTNDRRVLIDAYLDLGSDDVQATIAALREWIAATDEDARGEDWWVQLDLAEHRVLLARLLVQTGAPQAALAELERVLVDLQGIADRAPPIERERLLAATQMALADALITLGLASEVEDHDRIAALLGSARGFYLQWPDAYADRLDELETLSERAQP